MPPRHLFGPVTAAFAADHLRDARRAGHCLTFGPGTGHDLDVTPNATWADVTSQLPVAWTPDFIALWLIGSAVPDWVWAAPVPLIGLAPEWDLHWHRLRAFLPRCDVTLADTAGVDAFARAGLGPARPTLPSSLGHSQFGGATDDCRDIDLLFAAGPHAHLRPDSIIPAAALADLTERHRVLVSANADLALLGRAKVVAVRPAHSGLDGTALAALAAGACLLLQADDTEAERRLAKGREYVAYDATDLIGTVERTLADEPARARIAAAGRARAPEFSFDRLWAEAIEALAADLPSLRAAAERRASSPPAPSMVERAWEAMDADPAGRADTTGSVPNDADTAYLWGLTAAPADAAGLFARAAQVRPGHPMAGLAAVEALLAGGRDELAVTAARRALKELVPTPPTDAASLAWPTYPPGLHAYRVAWEHAAWSNAGDLAAEARAKCDLIRGRLHALLAGLTGDLVHYYEAAFAGFRPPEARAAVGCALARAGRVPDALPHLHHAVAARPFDAAAARALAQALTDVGDTAGRVSLANRTRRLCTIAPDRIPAEDWFGGPPLASILVVCCGGLEYTRLCVESVLTHTRPPYELILVDNGSTDGTADYLVSVAARTGPDHVEVIRNASNRGYPAAANQAAAAARGDFVAFLNNDAVVPAGWLDRLVAWLARDPKVGAVGPVSNYAPPPQLVPVPYSDPANGLAAFAADRRRFAGRALGVPRLSGFCMVARKSVLDNVGMFDEQFGVGFFDDDDFGLRLRRAGYKLLVAEDVFVHHFGSRTFAALGIDTARQLNDNLARFRAKWGDAAAAGYRPVALAQAPARRPTVSLCVIAKNEEDNLPDCLRGWQELFDEAVVVDTGSSDRTREVAADLGARVVEFPWVDSFAAARNASLDAAAGDWCFWLDADDRLDDAERPKLKALFDRLGADPVMGYALKCVCVGGTAGASPTVVDHVRLFRRDPRVRWEYRVHEQILPAIRRAGGDVAFADASVRHVGYVDAALRRRKLERDLRLLNLEDAEHPDDPFTLFNLGSVYQELGREEEALALLRRSLERSRPRDSIVRKLYALIGAAERRRGRPAEALAACREGLDLYPDDAELLFLAGGLYRDAGDAVSAAACWRRLLGGGEGPHFASVDGGLRGPKARHNLAVLELDVGRPAAAEALWRAALADDPTFRPARLGLAELCLRQGRWAELEAEAAGLDELLPAEAAALRARGRIERGEYAAARRGLEAVIAERPCELLLRVVLSHALLRDGSDPAAAERALRDVLALDPGHQEAKHNLKVLLARSAGLSTPPPQAPSASRA